MTTALEGPKFAVLNPALVALRSRRRRPARTTVVIALGGGAGARSVGATLASRLSDRLPDVRIRVATGFAGEHPLQPLPPQCEWLDTPQRLAEALTTATVAIVA